MILRTSISGFHLIELLIALAIVAVLFVVALPSYQSYNQRAKRADAVRQIMQAVQCQESWRGVTGSYDTTHCTQGLGNNAYTLEITPMNVAQTMTYTISAIPIGNAANDDCGVLSIDQAGTRSANESGASVADCWGGR